MSSKPDPNSFKGRLARAWRAAITYRRIDGLCQSLRDLGIDVSVVEESMPLAERSPSHWFGPPTLAQRLNFGPFGSPEVLRVSGSRVSLVFTQRIDVDYAPITTAFNAAVNDASLKKASKVSFESIVERDWRHFQRQHLIGLRWQGTDAGFYVIDALNRAQALNRDVLACFGTETIRVTSDSSVGGHWIISFEMNGSLQRRHWTVIEQIAEVLHDPSGPA